MAVYDVVVVGGGVNGLAVAVGAARLLGLRVAVAYWGPLGGLAGPSLGVGPAYSVGLLPSEIAEPLGLDLDRAVAWPDPSWIVLVDGEPLIKWWRGKDRLSRELEALGVDGKWLLGLLDSWRRCAPRVLTPPGGQPPSLEEAASLLDECSPGLGDAAAKPASKGLLAGAEAAAILTYPSLQGEPGLATLYFNTSLGVWGVPSPGGSDLVDQLVSLARRAGVDFYRGLYSIVLKGGRAVAAIGPRGRLLEARTAVVYSGNIACLPDVLEGDEASISDLLEAPKRAVRALEDYRGPERFNLALDGGLDDAYRSAWRAAGGPREEPPPIVEVWGDGYWAEVVVFKPSSGSQPVAAVSGHLPSVREAVEAVERALPLGPSPVGAEYLGPKAQDAAQCNPGGNPNHLPMTREFLLDKRPGGGWRGPLAPVEGLLLASASAHPGGQVTLMPAVNALQALASKLGRSLGPLEARLREAWIRGYTYPWMRGAEWGLG